MYACQEVEAILQGKCCVESAKYQCSENLHREGFQCPLKF